MKLIALSSLAAREFEEHTESILHDLFSSPDQLMLSIDRASVKQRVSVQPPRPPVPAFRIALADWLRPMAENYIPDQDKIRESAAQASPDKPIIIDASGYQLATILPVLGECRMAWFDLPQWHPGFVLLCNEAVLPYAAEALFDTFFARPQQLTHAETRHLVRGMRIHARLAYFFSFASSRRRNRVANLIGRFNNFANREERREAKDLARWVPQ